MSNRVRIFLDPEATTVYDPCVPEDNQNRLIRSHTCTHYSYYTCGWTIVAAAGQKFGLHFNTFSLNVGSDDSLLIYDGPNSDYNLIARLTGLSVITGDILASGQYLHISFQRQCSNVNGRFEIHYFTQGKLTQ